MTLEAVLLLCIRRVLDFQALWNQCCMAHSGSNGIANTSMSNETSKQMQRLFSDRRFGTRWIVGDGVDIGCGNDPLSELADFFPLMKSLRTWGLRDGDAMFVMTAQGRVKPIDDLTAKLDD
jgi:hypothetical protein